ncbi:MAG: hypothetical protein FJ265_04725 [Planctomycetes bacterium]|nr:hypothetical protein [Planctomycetota bacterium]
MSPLHAFLVLVVPLTLLPAQNCSSTSIAATALTDLGTGTYQGHQGGLYGTGQNTPPAAHLARGQAGMALVVPRDAAGNPAGNGRIVLLSIGMSNTTQEFSTWMQVANADPNKNPAVTIVDGAQGGQDAVIVANPAANFWTVVDQRLANAGVTGGFPGAAQQLQNLLGQIARNLRARFPHCELCFCSSRTYAGYATTQLNPEPYAYESGFAVQWLVQQQMNGDPQLNSDPAAGPVVAPWLGFGPYLWTNGLVGRGDGLVWTCADVQPDGTHPSPAGRTKVSNLLQGFFTTDPLTVPWYLGGGGTAASWTLYGSGCPGTNGVPGVRSNGLPVLGNGNFRVGVDGCPPATVAALCWSFAAGSVPIAGPCVLQLDPTQGLPAMFGLTQSNGVRIESVPIPNDQGLVGLQLFAQWGVVDAQGTPVPGLAGLSGSRAARLVVGW